MKGGLEEGREKSKSIPIRKHTVVNLAVMCASSNPDYCSL